MIKLFLEYRGVWGRRPSSPCDDDDLLLRVLITLHGLADFHDRLLLVMSAIRSSSMMTRTLLYTRCLITKLDFAQQRYCRLERPVPKQTTHYWPAVVDIAFCIGLDCAGNVGMGENYVRVSNRVRWLVTFIGAAKSCRGSREIACHKRDFDVGQAPRPSSNKC